MKRGGMRRTRALSTLTHLTVVAGLAAVPTVLLASPASASANVTQASYNNGNLLITGNAIWDRPITVDGIVMATSDGGGNFTISQSGYTSPADCIVDVNDGSLFSKFTVRLAGCTVTADPAPAVIAPDTADLGPFTLGVRVSKTVSLVGGI